MIDSSIISWVMPVCHRCDLWYYMHCFTRELLLSTVLSQSLTAPCPFGAFDHEYQRTYQARSALIWPHYSSADGHSNTNKHLKAPLQGRGLAIPFTKAANPDADLDDNDLRLPFLNKIPDSLRNHFIAMCGEFVGTVLFLWFALSGAQVANSIPTSSGLSVAEVGSNPQQLQYISLCFGFSLAVNAWVFFRISGGLFNPAVTFGMCLIGALPWVRGALLFFAQIVGGIVASALVSCMFPGRLNVQTKLGGGTSIAQGLFIEMFLTAQLIFTIFMLAAEKHKGTFIAPVGKQSHSSIPIRACSQANKTNRYRSLPLRCRTNRRLLHRWQSQPSSVLRPSSRRYQLRRLPLDLLARTSTRLHRRCRFLQVHQDSGVRDGESRPGHGPCGQGPAQEAFAHGCRYQ